MTKIAKRYAQALIGSVGLNNADELLFFCKSISAAIEQNQNLKVALLNPAVSLSQRKDVLIEIFNLAQKSKAADQKISSAIANFVDLLISKSRLSIITDIVNDLDVLIKQYRKALGVTFISAKAVSADQVIKLEQKLSADYGSLATVKWEVAPELIGGAKILVDDAIIDNSIKAKLDAMKETLLRQI